MDYRILQEFTPLSTMCKLVLILKYSSKVRWLNRSLQSGAMTNDVATSLARIPMATHCSVDPKVSKPGVTSYEMPTGTTLISARLVMQNIRL